MIKSTRRVATAALMALLLAVPVANAAAPAKMVTIDAKVAAVVPTKAIAVDTQAVALQFDGQTLALPAGQVAFNYQSRVYIPLRFVSYALLKSVAWDAKTSTVTVSEPTSAQAVSLQELLMNAAAAAKDGGGKAVATGKVKVAASQVKFVFDGSEKKLPAGQQAFNLNGTIYVPVRFMAESAGTDLSWDPQTKSVSGQSAAYREAHGGTSSNGGAGAGDDADETDGQAPAGGSAGNAAFEAVKAQTLQSLQSLQNSCINTIFGYLGQDDMVAKASAKLSSCQASFESQLSSARTQMEATGASAAEIDATLQGYRDTYNGVLQQYRDMYNAATQH